MKRLAAGSLLLAAVLGGCGPQSAFTWPGEYKVLRFSYTSSGTTEMSDTPPPGAVSITDASRVNHLVRVENLQAAEWQLPPVELEVSGASGSLHGAPPSTSRSVGETCSEKLTITRLTASVFDAQTVLLEGGLEFSNEGTTCGGARAPATVSYELLRQTL